MKNAPKVLGTLPGRCKDTSYQIQHTVCNFDYIICGQEMKGNIGDFL